MRSTDSTGAAGFILANITSRVMERAIQQGVEAGVKAGADYIEAEKRKVRKDRYSRRLHNTRLLLKNYRRFKEHVDGAVGSSKQASRESALDILDELDRYDYGDNLYIESIKRSQQRTAIILRHIDKMLQYYRIDCEQNGTQEDIRRYHIIMDTYITDPKQSAQSIAEHYGVECRTVYKDISIAMKPLTVLLFGIDGLHID